MVGIKCAQSWAKLNWKPRQAGKGVILISAPKLPWAPLQLKCFPMDKKLPVINFLMIFSPYMPSPSLILCPEVALEL